MKRREEKKERREKIAPKKIFSQDFPRLLSPRSLFFLLEDGADYDDEGTAEAKGQWDSLVKGPG